MSSPFFRIMLKVFSIMLIPMIVFAGQKKERTIKKENWRNEPVKIAKVKVKGVPIGIGQKTLADDDWLQGLTIEFKNTSGKFILFAALNIDFSLPQTNEYTGKPPLRWTLPYGHVPQPPGTPLRPDRPVPIAPDEKLEMVLSDEDYRSIEVALKELDYPVDVIEVTLSLGEVYFDDETMWKGGRLLRRDPDNPRRWKTQEPQGSAMLNPKSGGADQRLLSHPLGSLTFGQNIGDFLRHSYTASTKGALSLQSNTCTGRYLYSDESVCEGDCIVNEDHVSKFPFETFYNPYTARS